MAGASDSGAVLKIDVTHWNPGSRGGRQLAGGLGVGRAQIDLDVAVVGPEDGAPPISGHAMGYVRGGWAGGSAMGAPEKAAILIADVVTGRRR